MPKDRPRTTTTRVSDLRRQDRHVAMIYDSEEESIFEPDPLDFVEAVFSGSSKKSSTVIEEDEEDDDDDDDDDEDESSASEKSSSHEEEEESFVDAEDDASRRRKQERLNKLCYRLSLEDEGLTVLHLDFEKLDGRKLLKELEHLLPKNRYVTEVVLENACITKESSSRLAAALARSPSLRRISLTECKYQSDSAFCCFIIGLQHNPRIEEFAIVDCLLNELRTDVVACSLPLMKFKSLSLVNTGLAPETGTQFLFSKIGMSPDLASLTLSRNTGLSDRKVLHLLCTILREQQKITHLDLSGCGLDDGCIEPLVRGLLRNPVLERLNLSDNQGITDRGAQGLVKLLEHNNRIKELKVDGCKRIGKKKLKGIHDGLRYNNSFLQTLGVNQAPALAILESMDFIGSAVISPS